MDDIFVYSSDELRPVTVSTIAFCDFEGNQYNLVKDAFLDKKGKSKPNQKRYFENHKSDNLYRAVLNADSKILNLELMPYRLPKDSRIFIERLLEPQSGHLYNYALINDKAAHFEKDGFQYIDFSRSELIHPFEWELNSIEKSFPFQQEDIITYFENSPAHHLSSIKNLSVNWRLILGLGIESVYETGMCFHPVYGIPYLPASSIKGMLRSFIVNEMYGGNEDAAFLNNPFLCLMFGCDEKSFFGKHLKGNITFLDSFPTSQLKIEPDVMTVHFPDYYTSNQPPTDKQNPIPVPFLTVKGGKFDFYLIADSKNDLSIEDIMNTLLNETQEEGRELMHTLLSEALQPIIKLFEERNMPITSPVATISLLKLTEQLLIQALKEHGIGAKTAVDYGKMK